MRGRGLWHVAAGLVPYAFLASLYAVFIGRTAFRFEQRTYFVLVDDAMISMRYARNLADGHGLVWNPGQRVEGYTNFLWTLWMSVIHLLGLPEPSTSLAVMITGAVLLLLTVLVTSRTVSLLAPGRDMARVIAMLMVGLLFPLVFWTLRGMEVGLAAFLIGASVLLALEITEGRVGRRPWLLAGALAAAALTRDDLLVPAAIVVVYLAWRLPPEQRRRILMIVVGGVAAVVAAHVAYRLAYYNSALPNTYYLKLQGIGLGTRLTRGATGLAFTSLTELYPLLLLAAAYFVQRWRRIPPGVLLLAAVFAGQCAYSLYVGGDAWEYYRHANRYLTVALPSLAVIAALGIDELGRSKAGRRVAVAVGAVVLA